MLLRGHLPMLPSHHGVVYANVQQMKLCIGFPAHTASEHLKMAPWKAVGSDVLTSPPTSSSCCASSSASPGLSFPQLFGEWGWCGCGPPTDMPCIGPHHPWCQPCILVLFWLLFRSYTSGISAVRFSVSVICEGMTRVPLIMCRMYFSDHLTMHVCN